MSVDWDEQTELMTDDLIEHFGHIEVEARQAAAIRAAAKLAACASVATEAEALARIIVLALDDLTDGEDDAAHAAFHIAQEVGEILLAWEPHPTTT